MLKVNEANISYIPFILHFSQFVLIGGGGSFFFKENFLIKKFNIKGKYYLY